MDSILISICIPTFNSELYLTETIESIINQTYKNIEIIIGDNASTDRTLDLIRQYSNKDPRVSYYQNDTNIGYSKNCNKLISLSKGDYVAIYHSDDVYDHSIIEKQVSILNLDPSLLGVFTSYTCIDENGSNIENVYYPIEPTNYLLSVNLDRYIRIILEKGSSCFCCPTSMIRRKIYLELNGYDETKKYIEDQDMWARILLNGNLGIINQKLVKYRIHSAQGSSVYLNREIGENWLPLQHITRFLIENKLVDTYEIEIFKAEALEQLSFSKRAALINDFELYKFYLNNSVLKYRFNIFSKQGIIQNFPSNFLLFYIIRVIYGR